MIPPGADIPIQRTTCPHCHRAPDRVTTIGGATILDPCGHYVTCRPHMIDRGTKRMLRIELGVDHLRPHGRVGIHFAELTRRPI